MSNTLRTSCHCGNVSIEADSLPETVTECNCSICRRYGALWAYYYEGEIKVERLSHPINTYQWSSKKITFHSCSHCSCIMYYSSLNNEGISQVAVNARMAEPELLQEIPIRLFDGADTWQYLNESGT